ncbi:MAG: tagaturonate reductase [Ruminococcaceae bacterium]|nr:tagaturonate reductase [Oscillospiraceae bacterium]
MENITKQSVTRVDRPIKVIQFGEGNFLRAFTDYMIDIANEKGVFDGNIAIIKPIPFGNLERFEKQDNLYTVVLRGKENGKTVNDKRIITSVSKVLDAANDYNEYMALSELDSLRFVISNTTEAGIVLDKDDSFDALPSTYPGKLTKFLYNRFKKFGGAVSKGLIILPVELIENNGGKLRECVLALADIWALGEEFKSWIENANIFCSTLVDRIVTGYPGAEAAAKIYDEIGYTDDLIDVGEPFALWVIESDKDISKELPLDKAGLPVVFTNNQKPYRERKVRVLNGAHTSSVLAAYLCGFDIVRDCMYDEKMGKFLRSIVRDEIAPQVNLPIDEVLAFADSVFERFENPFIDHALLSISLNSVSKWKARVLPSFKDYVKNEDKLPKLITFSLAALLAFYSASDVVDGALAAKRQNGDAYAVRDDEAVIKFFAENSAKDADEFVKLALSNEAFWGEDLTAFDGLCNEVAKWYKLIRSDANKALSAVLEA